MFPKTQDHTIDRLLATQGRGPGNAASLCSTFDADLASAYVERRLSASETAGVEAHLAACPPCRKAIIALTRMALAEAEPARTDVAVGRTPAVSPLRRWLGPFATPQWAMAAAAAIVLAITLPLVLSHRTASSEQAPATEALNSQAAAKSPANEPAPAAAPGGTIAANNPAPETRETKSAPAAPSDKPAVAAAAAKDLAAGAAPTGVAGGAAASQPAEPKAVDQTVAKNEAQPTAPAPAPAAAEAPKSEEKAKTEVADDRKADQPATAQPARDEERAKSASAVAAEAIAPPPPPPTRPSLRRGGDSSRSRRGEGFSGPASAFRESSRDTHVPSRKVGGHQFWLRDGAWTDGEFDAAKKLPHTQVMRDSDLYRDLLANKEKIKPFLTGFPAEARVIFVFDGVAYFLIPQK